LDVQSGLTLPLPTQTVFKIPSAVIAHVGIANQLMISDDGEVVPKDQLTHDQTFDFRPKRFLNYQIQMNEVNLVVPVVFS
jgi:hypothetical protein